MATDLDASPSVRMSSALDRRLRIAAAHEDMNKTAFIREILRASIDPIEDEDLAAFIEANGGGDAPEPMEA